MAGEGTDTPVVPRAIDGEPHLDAKPLVNLAGKTTRMKKCKRRGRRELVDVAELASPIDLMDSRNRIGIPAQKGKTRPIR